MVIESHCDTHWALRDLLGNVFLELREFMTQDSAGHYNYLDPWLMQSLSKKTMTQSSCLHTLGVAFQSRNTVASHSVFMGLYQLYA